MLCLPPHCDFSTYLFSGVQVRSFVGCVLLGICYCCSAISRQMSDLSDGRLSELIEKKKANIVNGSQTVCLLRTKKLYCYMKVHKHAPGIEDWGKKRKEEEEYV